MRHDHLARATEAKPRRLAAAVAALLLTAGAAACATQNQSSNGGDDALPASMSELIEQAKREGEVYWSAPKPQNQMQPAIDRFEEKYGITVRYTNTKAPDQVTQLKLEQAAGKVTIDVANAGGLTVVPSQPLAEHIDWAKYDVDPEYIFENDFVYIWAVPKVWAYNTDNVQASELPKTWDDLLKSRWAGGKIAAESRASFMTVWALDSSMGDEKAYEWAKAFADQKPHFTENTTQSHGLIESGQVDIATSLANLVLDSQANGAPVAIAPLSPTNANEAYLYVPKGAPHPAAAVLLTSFLSSDEAQALLAESYNSRIPVETDCTSPDDNAVLKAVCDAGLEWFSTKTLDDYKHLTDFFGKAEEALGTGVG